MISREAILRHIRALAAKTVENGCTEAEAIAAAEKVASLMRQHRIEEDEVSLRASPFKRHDEAHADQVGERLWKPASAIAELTRTRYWTSGAGVHPVEIHFFGMEHEVEVAAYLLAICARAMRTGEAWKQRELALYRPAVRALKLRPFLDGMADRLRERIMALKPPAPTGRGLIVLHEQLVDQGLADAGIELFDLFARSSRTADPEYGDGRRAADQVALNPGVAGGRAAARLEGGRRQ